MLKRLFDLLLSIILLVIFSPVMVCMAFIIYFYDGFPILFKQSRAGLKAKPFILYKFRTMKNPSEHLISDAERLTALGKIMRRYSLDELPQLINILKGDMSFVGPRPLLVQYLPRYTEEQNQRHNVKPGITGWAQVKGRNTLSWEDKFKLDVWYVKHCSFMLDLKILVITFWKVTSARDTNQEGSATMKEFMGSSTSHVKKEQKKSKESQRS